MLTPDCEGSRSTSDRARSPHVPQLQLDFQWHPRRQTSLPRLAATSLLWVGALRLRQCSRFVLLTRFAVISFGKLRHTFPCNRILAPPSTRTCFISRENQAVTFKAKIAHLV